MKPTDGAMHVCCCCGKRFESADCLASWCDRCILSATQGRSPEQVASNERCGVGAVLALALAGLALVGAVLALALAGLALVALGLLS